MTSPTPIQIHISPSLHHLAIALSTFLSHNKQYTNLVVASFIFAPSTSGPRLLLVQRAATERAFPNRWEIPGGQCEVTDPTILHSLARETFEETGLRLTRFVRQVGSGVDFITGYGTGENKWCKLSFEIEVAEIEGGDSSCGKMGGHEVANKGVVGHNGVDAMNEAGDIGGKSEVGVMLDPAEHQAYAWVTETELREGDYAFIAEEHKDLMLEAFALRKADEDKSKAMLAGAESAVSTKQGSSEQSGELRR